MTELQECANVRVTNGLAFYALVDAKTTNGEILAKKNVTVMEMVPVSNTADGAYVETDSLETAVKTFVRTADLEKIVFSLAPNVEKGNVITSLELVWNVQMDSGRRFDSFLDYLLVAFIVR